MKNRRWRLLIDGACPPARNMAVDEALLRAADESAETHCPVLRFYGWEPSSLSIGYGQRAAEFNLESLRRQGYGFVRRPTGGGAIFHHRELTFSWVASVVAGDVPSDTRQVYALLNRGLIAGLRELGVETRERGCGSGVGESHEAFCSNRVAPFDLVCGRRKLVGSAQRWTKRVVLEHGFVPLEPNPLTHNELSLEEVLGRAVGFAEAAAAMRRGFESALDVGLVQASLTVQEARRAEELTLQYQSDGWNLRR
jgi:lipoate-protein ligase A